MKKAILISFILLAMVATDLLLFMSRTHTPKPYINEATDAIILLAPRKHTIAACAKLMKQNYAPMTLVATTKKRNKEYFTNFFKENNFAPAQFVFNNELYIDTAALPAVISKMIAEYDLSSIRIIADAAQMDRAIVELQNSLPLNINIIPHPVINIYDTYSYLGQEYFKLRIEQILALFSLDDLIFFTYDK
jgi:hypothetical protein